MTRGKAIERIKDHMVLEQGAVFDKIRSEITNYKITQDDLVDGNDHDSVAWGLAIAVDIIDKYMVESEE